MPRRHHRYTYVDYVALEADSSTKHEFLDGEIYAMAGGSEDHSALAAEVLSRSAVQSAIGRAAFTPRISGCTSSPSGSRRIRTAR